jgi:hypothetical protein
VFAGISRSFGARSKLGGELRGERMFVEDVLWILRGFAMAGSSHGSGDPRIHEVEKEAPDVCRFGPGRPYQDL